MVRFIVEAVLFDSFKRSRSLGLRFPVEESQLVKETLRCTTVGIIVSDRFCLFSIFLRGNVTLNFVYRYNEFSPTEQVCSEHCVI